MAYKPDPTFEENYPNSFPGFDPAAEPTKNNENLYPPAVEQEAARAAAQAKSGVASTYNTGQRVF